MVARGEKVGVLKVRLYRPFSAELSSAAACRPPPRVIAVLDRTKEPGAPGEPLYLDVVAPWHEARSTGERQPLRDRAARGRRSLRPVLEGVHSGMVKAVFDELGGAESPRTTSRSASSTTSRHQHRLDALGRLSSTSSPTMSTVRRLLRAWAATARSAPTRTRSRSSAENTPTIEHAQGYFVYDSKKSGATLRSRTCASGRGPIRSTYLIAAANFVAVPSVRASSTSARRARERGRRRRGLPAQRALRPRREVWDRLPREVQQQIIEQGAQASTSIDAYAVAREAEMGCGINTIMQTCFFAISGSCRPTRRSSQIKAAIEKTYGKRGEHVVRQQLRRRRRRPSPNPWHEVEVPGPVTGHPEHAAERFPTNAPDFVQKVTADARCWPARGDLLPVSAFPVDGTWPTVRHHQVGEAQHRQRDPRSGTRPSASSADNARWSARTPRSAPRS